MRFDVGTACGGVCAHLNLNAQRYRDALYGSHLSPWRTLYVVVASLASRESAYADDDDTAEMDGHTCVPDSSRAGGGSPAKPSGSPTRPRTTDSDEFAGRFHAAARSVMASIARIEDRANGVSENASVVVVLSGASEKQATLFHGYVNAILALVPTQRRSTGAASAPPPRSCAGESCGDDHCTSPSCPVTRERAAGTAFTGSAVRGTVLSSGAVGDTWGAAEDLFAGAADASYLQRRDVTEAMGTATPGYLRHCTVVAVLGVNYATDLFIGQRLGTAAAAGPGQGARPSRPGVPTPVPGAHPVYATPWNHLTNAHAYTCPRPAGASDMQTWNGAAAAHALCGELHRLAFHCVRAIHAPVPRLYAAVSTAVQQLKADPIVDSLSQLHSDSFTSHRSSLLLQHQGPNALVDTEELVQHLLRVVPTGTPKTLRRALLFLHHVGFVHAREVCCAPGVINDTVQLDPQFSARVLQRSALRVFKSVPRPPAEKGADWGSLSASVGRGMNASEAVVTGLTARLA